MIGAWGNGYYLIQNGFFGVGSNPGGSPFLFFLVGAQIRRNAARFSSIFQYTKGFRAFSMGEYGFSIEIASETSAGDG